ncbi:MAG: hypothetical protein E7073_05720 [Bacteroidales bacterium]|nr:hypothetical protein [Bacteroidales bacterium]
MTPQQFSRLLKANQEAVKRLISRVLPVKAGRMAKDHFSEIHKKCWADNLPSISSRSGQRPEAFVPVNRMASPDTANIRTF